MKTTLPISVRNCRLVAHRGLSGLETENTCAAFVAAALRGYWGIETDIHATTDGRFVICHDADLHRVSGVSFDVREHTLAEAQAVPLFDTDHASHRSDLRVPELPDYLAICAKHGKVPVIELKDAFDRAAVERIAEAVRAAGLLDRAVFISFVWGNCVLAREVCPGNEVMDLEGPRPETLLEDHLALRIGADLHHAKIDAATVAAFHAAGLRVNAWTVDDPAEAERLMGLGVDLITTNILEEAS